MQSDDGWQPEQAKGVGVPCNRVIGGYIGVYGDVITKSIYIYRYRVWGVGFGVWGFWCFGVLGCWV